MTIKQFFDSNKDLAIHCKTKEQAKALLEAFDKKGYQWYAGNRYIDATYWDDFEENTCYDNNGRYTNIESYKHDGYKILEFKDIKLMTLKEFFESKEWLAIHCDTAEKAIMLLKAFNDNGYKWWLGNKYSDMTCWLVYKEETCYTNTGSYTNREYFESKGYKIIEFDDIVFKPDLPKLDLSQATDEELLEEIKRRMR